MKARYAILALAAMLVAVNANAVDMHGYFRNAVGGSGPGGDQVTFKNSGQEYKLRLGNEDNWSEFEFVQLIQKDKNGVEWTAGFMLGWGDGFNGTFSGPTALQQEYIRATFPQYGGATVWGGKRFYHRSANDIFDYFYMNESGPGAGIEDVDLGFGKLSVAVFGFQGGTGVRQWMPDVRIEGIAVNPGGTLSLAALGKYQAWNKNVAGEKPDQVASFSPFLMVKHSQGGIMNGGNNLAFTYKTGCFVSGALNGVIKDAAGLVDDKTTPDVDESKTFVDCDKDLTEMTVSDDLLLQPTKQFSVVLAGIYNYYKFPIGDGSKKSAMSYGLGVRPLFKLGDHFALQGDAGYYSFKADEMDKANTMMKFTVAPTIVPFTDGFAWGVRPEIRFYATYASWNKEQNQAAAATFTKAGEDPATNGFTFGTQVETWF
jgi:maltoporin